MCSIQYCSCSVERITLPALNYAVLARPLYQHEHSTKMQIAALSHACFLWCGCLKKLDYCRCSPHSGGQSLCCTLIQAPARTLTAPLHLKNLASSAQLHRIGEFEQCCCCCCCRCCLRCCSCHSAPNVFDLHASACLPALAGLRIASRPVATRTVSGNGCHATISLVNASSAAALLCRLRCLTAAKRSCSNPV